MMVDQKSVSALRKASNKAMRDERGNIAILFGLLAPVLFMLAGAAIDYSRFNTIHTNFSQALEASTLAMSRFLDQNPDLDVDDPEVQAFAFELFSKNLPYDFGKDPDTGDYAENMAYIHDLTVTFEEIGGGIRGCAIGDLENLILGAVGRDFFDLKVCAGVTPAGRGKVELALVLDSTGSMSNFASGSSQSKMDDLKDAVETMLDVMFDGDAESDNLKIGVVPFARQVNAVSAANSDGATWLSSWEDTNAEAPYHGARFIHVEDGVVDMDTKVNHYELFDSVSGASHAGCFEARPYPLDEIDVSVGGTLDATKLTELSTPPQATTNARMTQAFTDAPSPSLSNSVLTDTDSTYFVPWFYGDEPDCDANWNGRCAYWDSENGTSYWERSQNISIGGSSTTVEWARHWFTHPDFDSYNDGDYDNRNFIDDERYIGRHGGENTARYAYIVEQFQHLGNGGLTTEQQDWRDFMEALGYGVGSGGDDKWWDDDLLDFIGDPDRQNGDTSWADSDEYILRGAYVGWYDSSTNTYDYKYDLNPSTSSANRGCDSNLKPILAMTNVRDDIETHVTDMVASGTTNTAIGAMWGWRVLSNEPPFTQGVPSTNTDWAKAVVIMTDGENYAGGFEDTHWGSDMGAYGYAAEERMGVGIDTDSEMEDGYDDKLLRICARMKSEGILVYTIMFDLTSTAIEEVYKACATEPNAPYFYNAPSGSELNDAFGGIAADLVKLHVSE